MHSGTTERRPRPWPVLPQKGNLPVARGIQGLADELHVTVHQLLHDVGPHNVKMGKVACCPQQDGLENLEY